MIAIGIILSIIKIPQSLNQRNEAKSEDSLDGSDDEKEIGKDSK